MSESDEKQPLAEEQVAIAHGLKWDWEALKDRLVEIAKFVVGVQGDLDRKESVPLFWAGGEDFDIILKADGITLVAGVVFGAVHCIAWFFALPTRKELLLWRISSAAIAAVPIFIPAVALLGVVTDDWINLFADTVIPAGILFPGLLYIIARAATLVLAFIYFRDLPPRAYETVHWTTLIPHV